MSAAQIKHFGICCAFSLTGGGSVVTGHRRNQPRECKLLWQHSAVLAVIREEMDHSKP